MDFTPTADIRTIITIFETCGGQAGLTQEQLRLAAPHHPPIAEYLRVLQIELDPRSHTPFTSLAG